MTPLRLTIAPVMVFLLSGCSGAPNGNDVEKAMEANIRNTIARQDKLAERIGGRAATDFIHSLGVPESHEVDIHDVAIQQSKPLDSGDYRLDVTYEATVQDISRRASTRVILGKRDGQWTVLN